MAAGDALQILALQRDTIAALDRVGIKAIVLKGLPVSEEAFGDLGSRQLRDLDVLTSPQDAALAGEVLQEELRLNFEGPDRWQDTGDLQILRDAPNLPCLKDVPFGGEAGMVELHWRLTANAQLMPVDGSWLARPRKIVVGGVETPVLPRLVGWWQLLVHGAEHDWHRLKWLADVAALASRSPAVFLSNDALNTTERVGLERCVASGLLTAESVLGGFLPTGARRWAHTVRGTRALTRRAHRALRGEVADVRTISIGELPRFARGRMALRRDWRFRAAEARCLLVAAARADAVPNPGVIELAAGPRRWLGRVITRSQGT